MLTAIVSCAIVAVLDHCAMLPVASVTLTRQQHPRPL